MYGLGFLYELGNGVPATSRADRAEYLVGAGKAAIGTFARLLRAPSGMYGTREIDPLPESTPDERAAKLAAAERLLAGNAKDCDARFNWVAHVGNLGLNLIGGLTVWLVSDNISKALESAGVGFAVGEVQIWSQPWGAKSDLKDYRAQFPAARPRASWSVQPSAGAGGLGAAAAFRF